MIKDILQAAAVPGRQGRYPNPPAGTYAVYFDDVTADGPDPVSPSPMVRLPRVYTHDVRLELYEASPDGTKEAAIEAELDARAVLWYKIDRTWLPSVQRYQVYYEFSYTTK